MRKDRVTPKFAIKVPVAKRKEIRNLIAQYPNFISYEKKSFGQSIFKISGRGPKYVELKNSLREYWVHRERNY